MLYLQITMLVINWLLLLLYKTNSWKFYFKFIIGTFYLSVYSYCKSRPRTWDYSFKKIWASPFLTLRFEQASISQPCTLSPHTFKEGENIILAPDELDCHQGFESELVSGNQGLELLLSTSGPDELDEKRGFPLI